MYFSEMFLYHVQNVSCPGISWLSAVQKRCLARQSTSASSHLSWEPASTWWVTPSTTGSFWVGISSICQSERTPSSKTFSLRLWSVRVLSLGLPLSSCHGRITVFVHQTAAFSAFAAMAHADMQQNWQNCLEMWISFICTLFYTSDAFQ